MVAVERGSDPIVEWDENYKMLAGAFPHLFLLGKGPPQRNLTPSFLEHCFKYYDGWFDDLLWIATAFNQKQRHAFIRKTARVSSGNAALFELLGRLANSKDFKEKLLSARDNPDSEEAKKLNAKICRIFSLVGRAIPFSPFERACTRPMLAAMRIRFSTSLLFHTGSPPEFEDLMVLRVALIKQFNDKTCQLSKPGFCRNDLPKEVLEDTGIRMRLTQRRPALSAQGYIRKQKIMNNDIIRCPLTFETRVSRNYTERQRGGFGEVAAHNTVIEPQMGGRLHWHKTLYLSALSPTLMNRLAAGPDFLIKQVAETMESLSCTCLTDQCHMWYNDMITAEKTEGENKKKRPRAADIPVPDASDNYEGFIEAAIKKTMLTNMHVHGFTCEKTKKGRYMCRLALPRGDHEKPTCPLLILGTGMKGNIAKGERPELHSIGVSGNENIQKALDGPYKPLEGCITRPHLTGPIVWEMHRPKRDAMFVESNLIVSNLLQCHNNAALVTGKDSGEAVEEYTVAYMTKEGAPLRQATAVLLAAVNHISQHTSRAEDAGTVQRTGIHLAQRTLNSFVGSHQWSMPLMVYALFGFKSYATTESFIYIFPHDNVSYIDKKIVPGLGKDIEQDDNDKLLDTSDDENSEKQHNNWDQSFEEMLDELEANENDPNTNSIKTGATLYKVDDKCIFLTQAESYANRGNLFKHFTQLEFECVIELIPKEKKQKKKEPKKTDSKQKRGRHSRVGLELGYGHPLYASHHGVVRMKMRTAMLGGCPAPTFPGNNPASVVTEDEWKSEMDYFAKYVMGFIVPWSKESEAEFTFDTCGLCTVIDEWNRQSAPLVK